jgi:hypothetical protein
MMPGAGAMERAKSCAQDKKRTISPCQEFDVKDIFSDESLPVPVTDGVAAAGSTAIGSSDSTTRGAS